jgi:hypothetical protein
MGDPIDHHHPKYSRQTEKPGAIISDLALMVMA